MNICFETYGCRLNRAEALENEAKCLSLGHRVVNRHSEADVFVVRGCSVTARAQRECEKMLRHLQHHYPNKRIIITGCLPNAQRTFDLTRTGKPAEISPETPPPVPTRTARAYLKVQDGCTGACTFCIVPKFRGESRSESFEQTLAKARRFIEAGYHEIVVTGCNLALYASEGKRLPDLIAALADLDTDCRIRLGSLEPWGCADEIVDVMAGNARVCKFLHIPVQSGSDRILKLMKRPYTVADVERIVERARTRMPLIAVGCDLMTGFPGESEGDFMQTRNLLTRLAFSNAHVFPYSERPGTPAAKMPGLVQRHVRSERAHTLGGIAMATRKRFAQRFIGREVTVVIESHGTQPKGWTDEYVWFEGPVRPAAADIGKHKQTMRFIVRSASDGILHGVPAKNGR